MPNFPKTINNRPFYWLSGIRIRNPPEIRPVKKINKTNALSDEYRKKVENYEKYHKPYKFFLFFQKVQQFPEQADQKNQSAAFGDV
ncbi:hypothetical protein DENIS_3247 [Desulfonema ishimotonii]|uniref:Uncharacterized protein n=1 Tax=Desulfonema ishimotonii TaxID=45657 RepID=A0A401FZ90_9BACT|nr:hypothetical protein DENIS_3247 [Desulfonema ishimotonii]